MADLVRLRWQVLLFIINPDTKQEATNYNSDGSSTQSEGLD